MGKFSNYFKPKVDAKADNGNTNPQGNPRPEEPRQWNGAELRQGKPTGITVQDKTLKR